MASGSRPKRFLTQENIVVLRVCGGLYAVVVVVVGIAARRGFFFFFLGVIKKKKKKKKKWREDHVFISDSMPPENKHIESKTGCAGKPDSEGLAPGQPCV